MIEPPPWLQDLRRFVAVQALRGWEALRKRLPAIVVVIFSAWLIYGDIANHDEKEQYAGFAFLAAAIAYAIYANRRPRWYAFGRTPTIRGFVWLCFGLLLANWLLGMLGTAAAIVGTALLGAGFVWSLSDHPADRTPVRRLLVAFMFSLLPLGWMAFDYWSLLEDEYRQNQERITEDLRARVKPIANGLERDLRARVVPFARKRGADELILPRLEAMSRDPYVDFAFYLPERKGRGNTFLVRNGEVLPEHGLSPNYRRVFQQAAERIYAQPAEKGKRRIRTYFTESETGGHGYLKYWSVRHDGTYGVALSMHRLAADLGGRQVAASKLAGKVRVAVAERRAKAGDVVLLTQDEMPEGWGFAQILVTPETFAQAQEKVDFKRLTAQIWFGILVVWLAAAFGNMYRTATRDMALADMKSNFVSSVTHELKTPLGMIRMYTEMLQLGLVGEGKKSEDYLHVISDEADRLARLIDNVLDFSKIQRGTKTYDMADVDLREVAVSALRNLEGAFDAAAKEVELVAPEALTVRADRDAALQAVVNLLSNAIKYGGAHIRVELTRAGPEIHLTVRDDGPGIPASEHGNVFQPFYRVGREEERTAQGTGLGLALVTEIMRAHHGAVRLSSQPDLDTSFTLAFPNPAHREEIAA